MTQQTDNRSTEKKCNTPHRAFSKLGWHKQSIIREAVANNGRYGYLFANNQQLAKLVEWRWLVPVNSWGWYEMTPEAHEAYQLYLKGEMQL